MVTYDISYEEARVYHFVDDGDKPRLVTVDFPDTLHVTEAGEHWITAEEGEVGFVVPRGWTHYEIFPRFGFKPFEQPADQTLIVDSSQSFDQACAQVHDTSVATP